MGDHLSSERAKMLSGELYEPGDAELVEARLRARRLLARYNATDAGDVRERRALLGELLGGCGDRAWIEPPFFCDYGWNITIGERAFLNFNCVILDCAPVEIGARTMVASAVQFCAATHPVDPATRRDGLEFARPIVVGANVWIGAGAIVGPGITIGDDSVVGAGSVVVRDVPPNVVAVGNPCRVVREL
jgi:maltose O-acetyltransferase